MVNFAPTQYKMKKHTPLLISLWIFGIFISNAQTFTYFQPLDYKGQFFGYWGWNVDGYTASDIHFKGEDYNFTLSGVKAYDRQSNFDVKLYCNPLRATIPQYNFRFGYFISPHYNISFGIDHMKYVVKQLQVVGIDGYIDNPASNYSSIYEDYEILIRPGFLQFEHTDGLNYINTEYRRVDNLITGPHLKLNATEGVSAGILLPKTNCTLLDNARYDEFHLAGFGMAIMAGLNLEIYKYFFIQSEFKSGYINMPDIRTTMDPVDRAGQQFVFAQWNVVFGANFNLNK